MLTVEPAASGRRSQRRIALALAGVFVGAFTGDAVAISEAAKAEGLFVLAVDPLPDGNFCLILES